MDREAMARESNEKNDENGRGRKRRRRGPGLLGRALGIMAFLPLASRAPMYARLIFALAIDERMPTSRKAMLAAAAGYLIVGRDLIPDEVPVLGGLDDLVIVVIAVDLFLDGVPSELLSEKLRELGIDRVAFDQDMARVRRLTPGPVRKTLRRVPTLASQAGQAIESIGVGPKVRAWVSKEDTIA
jgi:uncharacterized membrane protein YkvA (DUF1232 family)